MNYQTVTFDCEAAVRDKGVKVYVVALSGLQNQETNSEFEAYQAEVCRKILVERYEKSLAENPVLRGFRDLHTQFGFSNRTFPAASESLLEYLFKHHRLQHVNLLVDIYNLVSVETRLALGAHDLSAVSGNVHLGMTTGKENFWPLGALKSKKAHPGGYAYIDDDNDVLCFLEVKQVEKTRVTLSTTECLYIVQGNPETNLIYIHTAAEHLINLTKRFCGGYEHVLYLGE
jgi:DNA/RNA-binding domain of Phe-tRNA-synthetase-like protein